MNQASSKRAAVLYKINSFNALNVYSEQEYF